MRPVEKAFNKPAANRLRQPLPSSHGKIAGEGHAGLRLLPWEQKTRLGRRFAGNIPSFLSLHCSVRNFASVILVRTRKISNTLIVHKALGDKKKKTQCPFESSHGSFEPLHLRLAQLSGLIRKNCNIYYTYRPISTKV